MQKTIITTAATKSSPDTFTLTLPKADVNFFKTWEFLTPPTRVLKIERKYRNP